MPHLLFLDHLSLITEAGFAGGDTVSDISVSDVSVRLSGFVISPKVPLPF